MNRARVLGASLALALASTVAWDREASACGGCFTPPPPPVKEVESVITDEKMIFSISQDQTTLYDEIVYSGAPSSFAWVLPIKGTVTVGLSADILFATMEELTATKVIQPPENCPPPPTCNSGRGIGCGGSAGSALSAFDADGGAGGGATDGGVTVLGQEQVGPYETVQLHSNDGSALDAWLKSHGYRIPASDAPVIAAYVADHFDFLALKLVPGAGVQAMQPVRVTSKGAAPSLPLHMVAVGTGPTTGITIWVVADGRWEPQNFPTFTIADSELEWDWTASASNYETLRLSKEAALKGRGWQIESSLEISQYRIRNDLLSNATSATTGGYSPAGGGSGGSDAGSPDAGDAGSPDAAGEGGAAGEAGKETSAPDGGAFDPSGTKEANADLDVLLAGITGSNARITRMRSDVAHSALSEDMRLTAASDTSELTNLHYPASEIGQPLCPVYDDSCQQVGTAPRDQAIADAQGGCNTRRPPSGGRTTLALLLAVAGFGAVRIGRRRRARR